MTNSFIGDMFNGRGSGSADGWPGTAIRDGFDQLRSQFERKTNSGTAGPDLRASVLALLAEKPMHGYQIIHEIEERSGGTWKPSPGSVYPTLQLLADEGYIVAEQSDGRKTYTLTPEGRVVADAAAENGTPWKAGADSDSVRPSALPKAGVALAQAAAQVGRSGDPEQVKQAVAVLDEARRKLYSILAQG
jgi:hypothetical protein